MTTFYCGNGGGTHLFEIVGINPLPWTPGTASVGRKGGKVFTRIVKDEGLRVYQRAVHEDLREAVPAFELIEGAIALELRFWRRLEQYRNVAGHLVTRHRADATNMQKALEDALQLNKKETGFGLFRNDNQVVKVSSEIVAQGTDVEPMIQIKVQVL